MTPHTPEPLLSVRNLAKSYRGRPALRGITFTLDRGRTLGVVGESGSGKSTLARCLTGFEQPDSGDIRYTGASPIQLIFQQPASTLNPRFTAAEIVEEPLVIQHRAIAPGQAARALELVGLPTTGLTRRAHQFSGGERQRLAIARALIVEPALLILDESFVGLDPALQEQIAALLRELQHRLGLAYLLISHDLSLVADLAHDIAVIHEGRIVEQGSAADLLAGPQDAVTQRLVEAARVLSA